jgi:hypothetical protein
MNQQTFIPVATAHAAGARGPDLLRWTVFELALPWSPVVAKGMLVAKDSNA